MTVIQKLSKYYEGLSGDPKPKGVIKGSVFKETDTGKTLISFDGDNWVAWDKRVRLVQEDGTFIDLPAELDAIVTATEDVRIAVAALGYEFTIRGINFNGYAKIKSLMLDTGAYNDHPQTLHFEGVDYRVPKNGIDGYGGVNKIFVSFQALVWNQQLDMVGRIGESDAADGVIEAAGEILKLSNGTKLPFMTNCTGVFRTGKFVTAESSNGSSTYCLKSGAVLYGVEIDA